VRVTLSDFLEKWDACCTEMRQVHRAGDKLFIDYSGQTMPIIEAATGEVHRVEIFVAVLGASSYTYAGASLSQQLPDWIASHVRCFEYMGYLFYLAQMRMSRDDMYYVVL
jgi:transposase